MDPVDFAVQHLCVCPQIYSSKHSIFKGFLRLLNRLKTDTFLVAPCFIRVKVYRKNVIFDDLFFVRKSFFTSLFERCIPLTYILTGVAMETPACLRSNTHIWLCGYEYALVVMPAGINPRTHPSFLWFPLLAVLVRCGSTLEHLLVPTQTDITETELRCRPLKLLFHLEGASTLPYEYSSCVAGCTTGGLNLYEVWSNS